MTPINKIAKTCSRQLLLFIIPALALFSTNIFAQSLSTVKVVGDWKGNLNVGPQVLHAIIHIQQNADTLSVIMDDPDQGAIGMSCQDARLSGDSISFNFQHIITYKGKLVNKDSISGIFSQNGLNIPLNLNRFSLERPQTPKPPFPYVSRDVIFNSPEGKLQYGATITMPDSAGKFPAILLISGSGQQNRDEEIFGHKPFAVLADYLTRAGYLVMRVDDRGIGKTIGNFHDCTTFDFANDAACSLNYLKSLPQTDKQKLGIIGHSEGGIIAEMLAANRKDLDFIVLMAAPGIPSLQLQELQRMAATKKAAPTAPTEALAVDSVKFHYAAQAASTNSDTSVARTNAVDSLSNYFSKHPTGLYTSKAQQKKDIEIAVDQFIKIISGNKWLRQWLQLDARHYLSKISCKVLALNGSEDFQVTPKENLDGIKAALSKGMCKDFEIKELPGLNHLFQRCDKCTLKEYETLTQTLDPSLLSAIKDWLQEKVPANL